ncbi:Na(+)/H(+) exchange regulatory cofactor NHE-RF3 [Anguilla anguilla]|uniref:Na(+)/H(+) exchange regulatory cofactor NHE-RF3 n=1 Tax=Anguilla anguilla TaxID=7936 RepID=UPI0015AB7058|nr:Na(+)/H(+) exchange regulatory cofactor NHE-RF3 [Anguilla anguilla]
MATPTPRVINLSKSEGRSFGFFLREEQGEEGHLIRNLELGGPAELAGMKDGDRILRVNGTFVDRLDHSQVVDMVKRSGNTVTFHILDQASYKQAKADGVDLFNPQPRPTQAQPVMNGVAGSMPKPKLCFLVKAKNEYGFSLKSTHGEKGIFMTNVTPGGVAERAGVKAQDRIVEVNGENVEHATHEQIVEKVRASGASVLFLLADEETDSHYRNRNLQLRAELATLKLLPHKPRIAEVTKGTDGYGFFLRADPNMEGHFIKDIDLGSPAQEAGLRDMDRLVAVNGQEVESLGHEQVVERIRQCGGSCSLLVVDEETDKMYKKAGVSPLFYWNEVRGSHQQTSPPASPNGGTPAPEPVPTPPPASSQPIPEEYKPKLCKLEKTASGFGFHLNGVHGVPGQYLKEVVKGGVADRAGLEDDDVVIEVGGVNVEDSTHEQVVERITGSGDALTLLVVSKKAYNFFKAKKIPISTLLLEQAALDTLEIPETPEAPESSDSTLEQGEEEEERKEEEEEKRSDNGEETGEEQQEEEVNCPATPPSQSESGNRKASVSSSVSSSPSEDERL